MADPVYDNALKRQEELRRELQELEQFLLLYRRFSRTQNEQNEPMRITGHQPENAARIGPSDYADMAERLIREEQRPLTRGELADAIKKNGGAFPSDDAPRYLGTILWRNRNRFINVPGLGYAIPEIMTDEYSKRIVAANARSAELDDDTAQALFKVARKIAAKMQHIPSGAPGASIPPEIDRALLNEAGDELGRELYEPERINLREVYKLAELLT